MRSIPVAILGGSDRKPVNLPESGASLHPLVEYKGAALQFRGRPLVQHLVERLNAAEAFGPVTVTGPANVYGALDMEAEVVDSDGSVAENVRASIERCAPAGGPMAVLACDVLPTTEELNELRRRYEAAPCHLWVPFVRKPEDPTSLGVFAWKPAYRVFPTSDSEPVDILPAHLCIFEPGALRLPLLYRLMDATYRTRNRPVGVKLAALLSTALLGLLATDIRRLARLRGPTRTVTTVQSGLRLARKLRAGRLHVEELEQIIARIFLRDRLRDAPLEECVSFSIVSILSLAEDVDTEEEARALEV